MRGVGSRDWDQVQTKPANLMSGTHKRDIDAEIVYAGRMQAQPQISAARLELALEKIKASDWERFERLCSTFLASEFTGLRTMASPGGDRGRDAELFTFDGEPNALFQFAVRADWSAKIGETLKKLQSEFPETKTIVFLSSQQIGAKGDTLRKAARENGISLDIRDRSWFTERVGTDSNRNAAAAELARVIVDPYLQANGIVAGTPALEGSEARTALVFLELQAKDDDTAKGLTKSCFESLVKASLQGTTIENRKSRKEIFDYISGLLPRHSTAQLSPFIDAAITRLERSAIKYHKSTNDFHISHDEIEKTKDRVASLTLLQEDFSSDCRDIVSLTLGDSADLVSQCATLLRSIVEAYFYRLGEEFAQSVAGNKEIPLHSDLLRDVTIEMAPRGHVIDKKSWSDFLYAGATSLIGNPSTETMELFRVLSTAYTLFAFLSEVPDVQKATKKLFEHGTLWFDTTVLLPLFAEQAFPDDMRPFSNLITQLKQTGLKLRVTRGVIEEIERHLNLCKHYVRTERWEGRVPYVYQRYALAGGVASRFNGWLEQFLGEFRPLDDLAIWLKEEAGIEATEPSSFEDLPDEAVNEIRRYWQEIQDYRRRDSDGGSLNAYRLAEHDTENYLSVLAERRIESGKSVLGYTSWLVTMDSAAWRLISKVSPSTAGVIKHSPIISLDFLLKYLSFGPRRDKIEPINKGHARVFSSTIYENIPADLITVAVSVRANCHGLSERLVQRRVRDELDRRKMSAGQIQQAGLDGFDAALESMF